MSRTDRPVVLYKRWILHDGATQGEVAQLVVKRVIPHYQRLSVDVVLDLEAQGEDAVLAIQRWPNRASLEKAMNDPHFDEWWRDYQPVLADWASLLEFEEEWETEGLID